MGMREGNAAMLLTSMQHLPPQPHAHLALPLGLPHPPSSSPTHVFTTPPPFPPPNPPPPLPPLHPPPPPPMYRAYACGVGLPQRPADLHWQHFLKDNHHRRMREMRPEIDNAPPPQFPHLKSNLKKRQMDEERCVMPG